MSQEKKCFCPFQARLCNQLLFAMCTQQTAAVTFLLKVGKMRQAIGINDNECYVRLLVQLHHFVFWANQSFKVLAGIAVHVC